MRPHILPLAVAASLSVEIRKADSTEFMQWLNAKFTLLKNSDLVCCLRD